MNINKKVELMTLKEKISFCTGKDFWNTKKLPRLGVNSIKMSDGPHGLRCQGEDTDMLGINKSFPATCFPTAVTAGATWNRELYAAEGKAIGLEASARGVSVVLGPGCNIKRNPLCGRNFEYISEDPYLSGYMAASFIRGVQSVEGVSACVKHFAVNSQEYKRQISNSMIDERTLREIYLAPFEIAVKEGGVNTVMCSYNKINDVYASDNKWLLTDVLRREWGFSGTVITDWGALNDRIKAFEAGCDLNMPGGSKYMHKATERAVRRGELDEKYIDESVSRILALTERGQKIKREPFDAEAHHALARKIAEQGAVLLKNQENTLPLEEANAVLIGRMAAYPRYQGSGSSHINPTKLRSLAEAMPNSLCLPLGDEQGNISDDEIFAASEVAKSREIAVVAVGLPELYESEAFDREHLRLPNDYNRLVEKVAEANANTVVVLFGGGAMELPWADKVKAILYMGLSGQGGGEAAAELLTGRACPSGKLTESWPKDYSDVISAETFGKKNSEYRESVYVGYRHYLTANVAVRYPFGYGLSYTNFEYSDATIDGKSVSITVKNIGDRRGAEVVQLYVAPPKDGMFRPRRELKGFERVELDAGESISVRFDLDDRSFAVWQDGWRVPQGIYTIEIGSSSDDIRSKAEMKVSGEMVETHEPLRCTVYETLSSKPTREDWEKLMGGAVPIETPKKKGEYDLNSTISEMKTSSLLMKLVYKTVELFLLIGCGRKKAKTDPTYRMMLISVTDNPIRSLEICSGGTLNDFLSRLIVRLANFL